MSLVGARLGGADEQRVAERRVVRVTDRSRRRCRGAASASSTCATGRSSCSTASWKRGRSKADAHAGHARQRRDELRGLRRRSRCDLRKPVRAEQSDR